MISDRVINVSLAEIKTARKPHILATPSVGSCVAVMLYDESMGIGSMAHIMLPDVSLAKSKENKAKFANTAVEIMLQDLIDQGAVKRRIKAKIVGGANMFPAVSRNGAIHIGARNAAAVKNELKKRRIPLVAEDTGGTYGRSVRFSPESGLVSIKSALYEDKEI